MHTEIPGRPPIELVAWYEQFEFYYPRCELQTKQWFVENAQPDWTTLDIGANIGYYSILFSQLSPQGRVYAFEPTTTVEMLRTNLDHHGVRNVEVIPQAVGARSGALTDGVFRIWGEAAEVQEYSFTTVDDFVTSRDLQKVDCLKIDVDSFDFEVLQGAEATLRRFDPWVVVELNHALSRRAQTSTEAMIWLASLGYTESMVLDLDNFVLRRRTENTSWGDDAILTLRLRRP